MKAVIVYKVKYIHMAHGYRLYVTHKKKKCLTAGILNAAHTIGGHAMCIQESL